MGGSLYVTMVTGSRGSLHTPVYCRLMVISLRASLGDGIMVIILTLQEAGVGYILLYSDDYLDITGGMG